MKCVLNVCDFYCSGLALSDMMHEMGHTMSLQHSDTPTGGDAQDFSCIMGYWPGTRFFNAPQGYLLGW